MRAILEQSNLDLLREIEKLKSILPEVHLFDELLPYHDWILKQINLLEEQISKNLNYLNFEDDEFIEIILNRTQQFTRRFQLLNSRLVGPILRSTPMDKLSVRLLRWLHTQHNQTVHIPAGLSDGEFGIWPAPEFPIVYFMPSSAQRGLLYLPLFFHEFGHLLYACHRAEMDDLVKELQEEIEYLLKGTSHHDDRFAREVLRKQRIIVETWYEWTQEFFCDAVGLIIGGPCFLKTFSIYLRMTGRRAFQLPFDLLAGSSHPVTWVRIRILSERATKLGLFSEGKSIIYEWDTIAKTIQIQEDYFGFYDNEFLPLISKTLDDMLTEVSPYQFTPEDISLSEYDPKSSTPVHLLNIAWNRFLQIPNEYPQWEKEAIAAFIQSSNKS